MINHVKREPYLHNPKLRNRLGRVSSPTIIVRGAQDTLVPAAHSQSYAEEIKGAKYKLLVGGSGMDHRVIEFNLEGGSLVGKLVSKGRKLDQIVGVHLGREMFALSPMDVAEGEPKNVFQGVYKNVQGDGSGLESQVVIHFFEDKFTWNLESATWERVHD